MWGALAFQKPADASVLGLLDQVNDNTISLPSLVHGRAAVARLSISLASSCWCGFAID
jgi:hypothetical protein